MHDRPLRWHIVVQWFPISCTSVPGESTELEADPVCSVFGAGWLRVGDGVSVVSCCVCRMSSPDGLTTGVSLTFWTKTSTLSHVGCIPQLRCVRHEPWPSFHYACLRELQVGHPWKLVGPALSLHSENQSKHVHSRLHWTWYLATHAELFHKGLSYMFVTGSF